MTPQQLIRQTAALFDQAGVPDPMVDSSLLLSFVTGMSPLSLRLDRDTELSPDALSRFESLRDRRLARVPLQYLTHEQPFMRHTFYVDERVLIPRPETELLCERAIVALSACSSSVPTALDLCCGSGCIAVSMALAVPSAQVDAADLSPDALSVSRLNAERLGANVAFYQGDLFSAVGDARYDVIISNPPYIPAAECPSLQAEVLQEPVMALDGGADGLDFYRRIAVESPAHLREGGRIFLEVGYDQADQVAAMLRLARFRETSVHQDYQGISRMVEAHL